MNNLSPELLYLISKQLRDDPASLSRLRLVSITFATIASRYLFREFHLLFKTSRFNRLLELSKHPSLSKCVRTIYYDADTLRHYPTKKAWRRDVIEEEGDWAPTDGSLPWQEMKVKDRNKRLSVKLTKNTRVFAPISS